MRARGGGVVSPKRWPVAAAAAAADTNRCSGCSRAPWVGRGAVVSPSPRPSGEGGVVGGRQRPSATVMATRWARGGGEGGREDRRSRVVLFCWSVLWAGGHHEGARAARPTAGACKHTSQYTPTHTHTHAHTAHTRSHTHNDMHHRKNEKVITIQASQDTPPPPCPTRAADAHVGRRAR